MPAHVFFQEFGINPNSGESPQNSSYSFNTLILEISNNFDSFSDLIYSLTVYGQKDQKITNLDVEWINFIKSNNIDILSYQKDSDRFINENLKRL